MIVSAHMFLDALAAEGAAADRGANMNLYGWLIGSWDLDVSRYLPDGTRRERPGEWHFGWVLEGRAIQDVWIVPPRGPARAGDAARNANAYGTTLRTYDPSIDAWHIQWTEPVTQTYLRMIGRRQGNDIVQLGTGPDDTSIRWSFSGIAANAFHWRGEISADRGTSWRTNVAFAARRAAA
ncbi:MAG: hypothetical protein AB7G15_19090 [Alphaproteobacteria bacterium]